MYYPDFSLLEYNDKANRPNEELISNLMNDFNVRNDIMQPFDATKYTPQSSGVFPYLYIKENKKYYHVYDGSIGNNRFNYFVVPIQTDAGKLCNLYLQYENGQKKFDRGSKEIRELPEKIIEACKLNAIEKANGFQAYLKYWQDCITADDKKNKTFHGLQSFEVLKDWYNIQFARIAKDIENNVDDYPTEKIRKIALRNWKNNLSKEVFDFLKTTEIKDGHSRSTITLAHAIELNDFYEWLQLPAINDAQEILFEQYQNAIEIKKASENKKSINEKFLNDIWLKDAEHYQRIIDFLKDENTFILISFVKEIDGKYYWQKFHGNIKYLAAFIKTCIDKGFIQNKYSAPKIRAILFSTFNIEFDKKPFEPNELNSIDRKYFTPFLSLK